MLQLKFKGHLPVEFFLVWGRLVFVLLRPSTDWMRTSKQIMEDNSALRKIHWFKRRFQPHRDIEDNVWSVDQLGTGAQPSWHMKLPITDEDHGSLKTQGESSASSRENEAQSVPHTMGSEKLVFGVLGLNRASLGTHLNSPSFPKGWY